MKKILFVDDEPNLLQGLQRMLRPMRHEWDMTFVASGEAALDALADNDFTVLVTDMRMPGMNGAQLLERVKRSRPGIARIVLSGQTDMEDVLKSTGTAHQFIAKPCDAAYLKNAVERSCRIRELLGNRNIVEIVGGIDTLPSLPEVYRELTEEMTTRGSDLSLKRISQIITRDVAMSAKVMQIASSAFFSTHRIVETAQQAVMVLGAEVIRSLVLVEEVFRQFDTPGNESLVALLHGHSMAVGAAASNIARLESVDGHIHNQSLQAGALHEIGKLILASRMPDLYRRIVEQSLKHNVPQSQVERDSCGCDHGQIGAFLLGLWGLPDGIVEAVAYHHSPAKPLVEEGSFSPLIAVYAANHFLESTLPIPQSLLVELLRRTLGDTSRFQRFREWSTIAAEAPSHQGSATDE
jgi:HD-like signal output (HDOD) protein